jgi:hypothetical protein
MLRVSKAMVHTARTRAQYDQVLIVSAPLAAEIRCCRSSRANNTPLQIGGETQSARRENFRDGFAVDELRFPLTVKFSFSTRLALPH